MKKKIITVLGLFVVSALLVANIMIGKTISNDQDNSPGIEVLGVNEADAYNPNPGIWQNMCRCGNEIGFCCTAQGAYHCTVADC